jgi:hypothetical protein
VFQLILKEQHIILNLLLIKEMLLLNSIMGFVCTMANVLQKILKVQPIISNLLLIKDILMLNSIMDFVCAMGYRVIWNSRFIFSNWHQIKAILLLKTPMLHCCGMAEKSKHLANAERYFRDAANQVVAEAQYRYGICLLTGHITHRDIAGAIRYLRLSAEIGSPDGQFIFACMAENGLGTSDNVDTTVRYYQQCSDLSPAGSDCFG